MKQLAVLSLILVLSLMSIVSFGQVSARWELVENHFGNQEYHQAQISLTNTSSQTIEEGWNLYFNTIFISVATQSLHEDLRFRHLQGDFFTIEGKSKSPAFAPGETLVIPYRSQGSFLKNSYAPEALIFENANGSFFEIKDYQTTTISKSELIQMAEGTSIPIAQNETLIPKKEWEENQVPPFLPSPKQWNYTGPTIRVKNAGLGVVGDPEFVQVASFLLQRIKKGYKPQVNREEKPITIQVNRVDGLAKEAYRIQIEDRKVVISATSPEGALYGVQSFLAMMPAEFWGEGTDELILPQVEVEDEPAFGYRGLFLDVARNFQPKGQILKLLDLMSFYKLNVFHFNLANDEGWRIEIPGLPELTDFGSRRGFSKDEQDFLWPYYGSGAYPEQSPSGTGYYTREDFKEILAYAHSLHIEVIPELGVPAHSRAAILAMEKRYRDLMKAGKPDEALRYRLADPDDRSVYLSAQNFKGNTVCVCQESTYTFYEKLIQEIKTMYQEAQVPLQTWHTGGDEVPRGAWKASPICDDFLAKNPEIKREDLNDYFRFRVAQMLKKEGIGHGGWEEIGQSHQGDDITPNEKFADQNWRLYAWNAVAGWGGEDMAYRLANAGYPVVICSSANFYFDLAYNWDPDERGHTWSGVVDTYQAWKTVPGKLYLSHDQTIAGDPWDWKEAEGRFTQLTEKGKSNILGVSGQLWTETVKSPEMMEYYLLPKMLGYVERAWAGDPKWASLATENEMKRVREDEWDRFVFLLRKKELPRLERQFGGFNFREPAD
ncbi:family 20 glycosylhydrolase [Algoriphagus taiwanensis]|uniref:beta-N-acetylhexosaminidase n=1 Tax=Algoriphagus taiwanensis TaxID=1445656 RepID=A0ABQ6PXI6_9BACT|nr:family 20 glycosylhydrolase [Algoriphagus taiwanensis]